MRNLKKFLALVLAMLMTLSLMVTVNAAHGGTAELSDEDAITAEFSEATDVLMGMKVIAGYDDGTFKPASTITRAEAAALIYRLVTGDVTDVRTKLYAEYGNFPDVTADKWYAGYVGYCANQELILGRPDGYFHPSDKVTGYEILAMILRAVGYGTQPGEFTGSNWQVTVASRAQTLHILDNINHTQYGGATLQEPARRDVVAELLFETVAYVPTVQWTTAFGYQDYGDVGGVTGSVKNDTLGYKIFGLTSNTGVIVGNEMTGEPKDTTKIGFSLDSQRAEGVINVGQSNDVITGYNAGSVITFYSRIDNTMAIRGQDKRSAYIYESDTVNPLPENVTRTFKWTSSLREFNHAVKVWYNNKSSDYVTVGTLTDTDGNTIRDGATGRFTTNLTTYAVIDKVVKTAVVSLWDENRADDPIEADLGTVATRGNLGAAAVNSAPERNNNWNAPNMELRTNYGVVNDSGNLGQNYAAYFNYSFGPMFAGTIAAADTDLTDGYSPTWNNNSSYGSGVVDSATDPVERVADSVVNRNNEEQLYRLYLLISNTESATKDGVLDVVIPLDMTFSAVVQTNNTTNARSVSLLAGNEDIYTGVDFDGRGYAYFGDRNDYKKSSDQANNVLVELAQANTKIDPLYAAADSTLLTQLTNPASPVAAIEVTGTAPGNLASAELPYNFVNDGAIDHSADAVYRLWDGEAQTIGNAPARGGSNQHNIRPDSNGMQSTYYYHLTKNHNFVTATVLAINPNNQTLTVTNASNGATTLRQSVFAEATDANFTRNIEGVDKDSKDNNGSAYLKVLEEGKTYTFTMDEQGNYIWWKVGSTSVQFVYGTYIDFDSAVGSSKFVYPLIYVDQDGNQRKVIDNVSKIYDFHRVNGSDNEATFCVTTDERNPGTDRSWHDTNTDAGDYDHTYTTFWGNMSGAIYNDVVLPKGDTGTNAGLDDAGFRKGFYVGYAYNPSTGTLESVAPYDITDPDTEANDSRYSGFYQATAGDFGYDEIVIGSADVSIRTKQVNNHDYHVNYFLTDKTKFVLVDGAGTDNQEAEVLVGLDALRKDYSTVTIDVTDGVTFDDHTTEGKLYKEGSKWLLAAGGNGDDIDAEHTGMHAWEMVYFTFEKDEYAQNYDGSARRIDTIFIPRAAVKWENGEGTTGLYFVGSNTQTNISSWGQNVTQFTFYNSDGVAKSLWVEGHINEEGTSAWVIANEGTDIFYRLIESKDYEAADGQPVYAIRNAGSSGIIGRAYNGRNDTTKELQTDGNSPEDYIVVRGISETDATGWAEYQVTTLGQSAWIDDPKTYNDATPGTANQVSANLYYVGNAKVLNLNGGRYPGVTELLATLNNASSNTDNERVQVSCFMDSSTGVRTIIVNFSHRTAD